MLDPDMIAFDSDDMNALLRYTADIGAKRHIPSHVDGIHLMPHEAWHIGLARPVYGCPLIWLELWRIECHEEEAMFDGLCPDFLATTSQEETRHKTGQEQ